MATLKITWLHGALSYAERHQMTAAQRIAAEQRALAMTPEGTSEIIVTACDTIAIYEEEQVQIKSEDL